MNAFLPRLVTRATVERSEFSPRRTLDGKLSLSRRHRDLLPPDQYMDGSVRSDSVPHPARPVQIEADRREIREPRPGLARPREERTTDPIAETPGREDPARRDDIGRRPVASDDRLMPLAKRAEPRRSSAEEPWLPDGASEASQLDPRPKARLERRGSPSMNWGLHRPASTRATDVESLEDPTVTVHIGRIDVRAVAAAAPAPPASRSSTRLPKPSLDAYLARRERGRP